ncbi:MAG: hypothetical protein IJ523_01185 [Succinivibrionaceae bacterium]|nr:hypothetical protein [Succinivibrionaceae bacterium]
MARKRKSPTPPLRRENLIRNRVKQDEDGIWRWSYDVNLYTDLHILFLVFKVMLIASAITSMIVFSIMLFSGNIGSWEDITGSLGVMGLVLGIILALSVVGYYLYALINGGKYSVRFEMSEQGIRHIQQPKQAQRNRTVGALTTIAGVLSGRPSAAGAGMMAASRTRMHTGFKEISRITASRSKERIILKSGFESNEVYMDGMDFDFVLDYIRTRAEPATKTIIRD